MQASKTKAWTTIFFFVGLLLFIWLNFAPPGGGEQNPIEPAKVISKTEASLKAAAFMHEQFGKGDWEAFASYDTYVDAQGYMTKEKLEQDFDTYWLASVPADYYRVMVKNTSNKTYYSVLIKLADGAVFGYERLETPFDLVLPEQQADAAAMLSHMGYNANQFTVEDDPSGNAFVFRHNRQVGDASLSIQIRMAGGEIAALLPVIDVPEDFITWKDTQDNKGAITSIVSLLLWFCLAIAAIVYMVVYRATMSFGRGVWLTLGFLVPYLIHNVNMYPGYKLSTGTEDLAPLFIILFSQFIMILMAASVYVCLVAGDGLWHRMGFNLWPSHREIEFGKHVMRAVGIGYVFCVIILGLQTTLFYLAGELFDVWFGTDPLQSSHNLLWPSLYPLLSWSASISEEAVFRIFAIAFFIVLLRPVWRWVSRLTGRPIWLHPLFYLLPAILLANVLWALGHTSYSIYPVYTRLVEVTILGFVFAYIFLRYGLIAAIFTHATLDIVIMSLELISSGERYAGIGFLYMLMPLAIGLLVLLFSTFRKKNPPASSERLELDPPPTLP